MPPGLFASLPQASWVARSWFCASRFVVFDRVRDSPALTFSVLKRRGRFWRLAWTASRRRLSGSSLVGVRGVLGPRTEYV